MIPPAIAPPQTQDGLHRAYEDAFYHQEDLLHKLKRTKRGATALAVIATVEAVVIWIGVGMLLRGGL